MVQRGQDCGFARESGQAIGVVRKRIRQDLQRDIAIELGVARAIDLAHAAGPKGREDLVGTKAITGGQAHREWPDYTVELRGDGDKMTQPFGLASASSS